MKEFCIPKEVNKKILEQLDNGQLSIDSLLNADYDKLDDIIKRVVGEKYSNEIADRFVRRFKTQLSKEDSINIAKMFTKVEELKNGLKKAGKSITSETEIMEWARLRREIDNYLGNIVRPNEKLTLPQSIQKFFKDEVQRIKDQNNIFDKIMAGGEMLIDVVTAPIYKSLKASFDMSYMFRQGFKILVRDITEKNVAGGSWKKGMEESWKVWRKVRDKKLMQKIMDEHAASLMSKENYQRLVDNGLAIGVLEDWFPTVIAERIWGLGKVFKASNESFTVFSQQARFSIADDLMKKQMATKGRQLTNDEIKAITQFANSVSGRGSLGRFEASSGLLNKLVFSARFIRSQVDTFIMPFNRTLTPEVRKEALKETVGVIGTIGAMMMAASPFFKVETDPRSSNFGKAKIGENTWVDLTAGLGSYISLAVKQATKETKSAKTGKISELNTGKYGSQTRLDVLSQWFQNKLAPAPSAINTMYLRGTDFKGDEPDWQSIAKSLTIPISLENLWELSQTEEGAIIIAGFVSDTLGLSTQTFK